MFESSFPILPKKAAKSSSPKHDLRHEYRELIAADRNRSARMRLRAERMRDVWHTMEKHDPHTIVKSDKAASEHSKETSLVPSPPSSIQTFTRNSHKAEAMKPIPPTSSNNAMMSRHPRAYYGLAVLFVAANSTTGGNRALSNDDDKRTANKVTFPIIQEPHRESLGSLPHCPTSTSTSLPSVRGSTQGRPPFLNENPTPDNVFFTPYNSPRIPSYDEAEYISSTSTANGSPSSRRSPCSIHSDIPPFAFDSTVQHEKCETSPHVTYRWEARRSWISHSIPRQKLPSRLPRDHSPSQQFPLLSALVDIAQSCRKYMPCLLSLSSILPPTEPRLIPEISFSMLE